MSTLLSRDELLEIVDVLPGGIIVTDETKEEERQEMMNLRSQHELEKKMTYKSKKMDKIILISKKIASVDSTVLLTGESGTGKELLAYCIHSWSKRKDRPFITFDCGVLQESYLEAELFGSGLNPAQTSIIEAANGGTLFLDDIDKLSLNMQTKLLHLMQNKYYVKPGSGKPVPVNIRIITSTNKNMEDYVKLNRFRKDLFYYLNVVPINIPPLRERKEDIVPLVQHFTRRINNQYHMQKKFTPKLLKQLQDYSWPGNVRELQSIVERLLVMIDEPWIDAEDLPESMSLNREYRKSVEVNRIIPLKEAIELLENELLKMAMEKFHSTTKMAEFLGVNQSTISRKLQRLKK
ncbi:sigma-54 interaction domain-containing protein [Paenibacillus beijingensis]|uniref:sigma-54 interaction domain-containing protein n=1 Tax=Paenibacillus beijingensis TaxID=1126833 RepID=UPI000696CBDD|nr:sigma-54 dependent transcriptional regulator [Paenibacillus beijingensis]